MKNRRITTMLVAAAALLALADAASAYYSPRLGRFLSRDPISEPGAVLVRQATRPIASFLPRDPIDQNGYTGMQNNAISWFDPDGGQATTQPTSGPSSRPSPADKIELWCYNIFNGMMHCDIKCVDGTSGKTLIGGGTGSGSSGGNGGAGGDPSWRIKTGTKGTLAGSTNAPAGTCDCINKKGDKINTIQGKIYDLPPEHDGNISNSGALASTLLKCCGVSISPSVSAPGWGDQVEYRRVVSLPSTGTPGFGPSFPNFQCISGKIGCKDLQ